MTINDTPRPMNENARKAPVSADMSMRNTFATVSEMTAADAARSPERVTAPDASVRGARQADAGEQLLAGYRALARQTAARAASSGRIDETTYRAVLAALDGEERP